MSCQLFRTTCVRATGAYRAVAATGDITQDAMPAMALRIAANLKAGRRPKWAKMTR
ncbi:hypothetical protein XMIN_3010 [Xanthomonas citri pv. mangiferaeindicae LMG 941]|nr:hypothetical protein XAPC_2675 [Xanthomonas citri pv. punicae str. LMG 859]CCG38019.1 hypothetical protein XMIN_3010 [Xanthomonas citri pv. mangiferaeindicae LMG 941]